jgi:hypothetical protein
MQARIEALQIDVLRLRRTQKQNKLPSGSICNICHVRFIA